jgi:hypothetical protein
MSIPEAFCVQTGTLMTIQMALNTCVARGGERLDFLCPNDSCQTPQPGQSFPARVSGVAHQWLFTGIKPLRAAHFRVLPDVHDPNCPIPDYAEASREVGRQRRGRLKVEEHLGMELPLIVDEFHTKKLVDEASAGQITDREQRQMKGATRAVQREIIHGAFRKNPIETARLMRLVETYEVLKQLNLLDQRIVRIDGRPVSYRRLFLWAKWAAEQPLPQFIDGKVTIQPANGGYKLEFFSKKTGPLGHRIYVKNDELKAYRFRARLLEAIDQIEANPKKLIGRVYFYAAPTPNPYVPGKAYFRIDNLENLVIRVEPK